MPVVDGLDLDMSALEGFPVANGHGTYDDVISVQWGRQARERTEASGADVLYREYPLPHTIDPTVVPELRDIVRRATTRL